LKGIGPETATVLWSEGLLRGDQDAKTYCLTRGRYPTSGCCLSEMLPLPHALATEHLDLFISQ